MNVPAEVLTAPHPAAAFAAHKAALAEQHGVTLARVDEVLPEAELTAALATRTRMEELWPDAPADCHLYACWNRPASEYYLRLPDGAQTKDQRADWLEHIPWTYIATPTPLGWPDVQLLRLPLVGER